ncbi:PREDICTED: uncharacterized protein LOC109487624 [Branchiostoma belcheri]|uniref:Uncharacterized protein LOC109487624 n=1 Tax=Branchiostoma belcheri TaxID=7741 RepID=A0A6P5AVR7_BRABE|nr:PREDICTED: uncharacterized protein LOC109487624 [Branchiostoma belcheri]
MASSPKSNDVLIINCDETYPLDSVEALVKKSSQTTRVDTAIEPVRFSLPKLAEVSEEVKGKQLLCAILVLNAHESRLSINEKNAGIGYAVLYRALREASDGRVLVVIGSDEKSSAADGKVVSNWVRYKVASQFEDEYLDGRRGFVFSWGKSYYPVHEEAFQQYLRAIGSGKDGLDKPFSPAPVHRRPDPTPIQPAKQLPGQGQESAPAPSVVGPPPRASPNGDNILVVTPSTSAHPPTNSTSTRVTQPNPEPPRGTQVKSTGPAQTQSWPVLPEKGHPKAPGPVDVQRQETEDRLRAHFAELKQKYPEYRGKLLGVIKYGRLDVGYTYALDESVLHFEVPKYITKTFYDEQKATGVIDVVIYEDPKDGELAFMYLDATKSSKSKSSSGWRWLFSRK